MVLFRGKQSHAPRRGLADLLRQQVCFLMGEGDQARSLEKEKLYGIPRLPPGAGLPPQGVGLQIVTGDEE